MADETAHAGVAGAVAPVFDMTGQPVREAGVPGRQGADSATARGNAEKVMAIETKLAEASMTRVQTRNPDNIYHKTTLAELNGLAPNFIWSTYFKNIGLANAGSINVGQPDFVKALNAQLTEIPLDQWKTYLRWHLLNARARALPRKFVEEDFDFNNRILTGTKEPLPRWKRCVAATDNALGEALGQVYVQKHFPPTAKARAMQMVQNLISALRDDLAALSWMDDTTRKRATAKLEAFTRKIGYPDQWRDYATLKVSRNSYAENLANAQRFETNRQLTKIAKPVNRGEWGMSPPTINAYYNPSLNEIVFPAGILQPPFYDPAADDAINYGGIGAVIGHEMSHGFDDSGAKFDAEGKLNDWWTAEDAKTFEARAKVLGDQYSKFEPLPGAERHFSFSEAAPGERPAGFRSAISGEGEPGTWKIVEDETPPELAPTNAAPPMPWATLLMTQASGIGVTCGDQWQRARIEPGPG